LLEYPFSERKTVHNLPLFLKHKILGISSTKGSYIASLQTPNKNVEKGDFCLQATVLRYVAAESIGPDEEGIEWLINNVRQT